MKMPSNPSVDRCTQLINDISDLLRNAKPDKIPIDEYEDTYLTLTGIREIYECSWDDLENELEGDDEQLLHDARADNTFKEYLRLRATYDRVEKLR